MNLLRLLLLLLYKNAALYMLIKINLRVLMPQLTCVIETEKKRLLILAKTETAAAAAKQIANRLCKAEDAGSSFPYKLNQTSPRCNL